MRTIENIRYFVKEIENNKNNKEKVFKMITQLRVSIDSLELQLCDTLHIIKQKYVNIHK